MLDKTKEYYDELDFFKPTKEFNGIVIIPTGELHESGYGCMKFVLTNCNEIVGCVGGYSDVIDINGIGGYGKFDRGYKQAVTTNKVPVVDWQIDCLPCGYLRLFSRYNLSIDDIICSNFIVYAEV